MDFQCSTDENIIKNMKVQQSDNSHMRIQQRNAKWKQAEFKIAKI